MRILLALLLVFVSLVRIRADELVKLAVTEVLDGDTIKGTYKNKKGVWHGNAEFRLLGIKAPPFWKQPEEHLRKMIGGKSVYAIIDEEHHTAIIKFNDENINKKMVESGHARYQPADRDSEALRKAQEDAKTNKTGLWGQRTSTQDAVDRLLNRYGGKSELDKLGRLKVSIRMAGSTDAVIDKGLLKVAWDMPKDRLFVSQASESPNWSVGFLSEKHWMQFGNETLMIQYDDKGRMVTKLGVDSPRYGAYLSSFVLGLSVAIVAKASPDALGEPSTIFDAIMEESLGKVDAPRSINPVILAGEIAKLSKVGLLSDKSDIETAAQSLRLLSVEGDKKPLGLLALHICEDGALIAIDCEFPLQIRAFLKQEAFERYDPNPGSAFSTYGLIESIEPLTEEDEALFNPPEVNADDAKAEEAK